MAHLDDRMARKADFETKIANLTGERPQGAVTLAAINEDRIAATLAKHQGNKSHAAADLGVDRRTLLRAMDRLGMERDHTARRPKAAVLSLLVAILCLFPLFAHATGYLLVCRVPTNLSAGCTDSGAPFACCTGAGTGTCAVENVQIRYQQGGVWVYQTGTYTLGPNGDYVQLYDFGSSIAGLSRFQAKWSVDSVNNIWTDWNPMHLILQ